MSAYNYSLSSALSISFEEVTPPEFEDLDKQIIEVLRKSELQYMYEVHELRFKNAAMADDQFRERLLDLCKAYIEPLLDIYSSACHCLPGNAVILSERFGSAMTSAINHVVSEKLSVELPEIRNSFFAGQPYQRAIWERLRLNIEECKRKLLDPDNTWEPPADVIFELNPSQSTDELAAIRKTLLDNYKADVGKFSNAQIYQAGNFPAYKPEFYKWLNGVLRQESSTTESIERFFRERKPPGKRRPKTQS